MDLDYDLRLRLAVFDQVDRLQRESGGVIPSARLNEGIRFEGRRIPIWNQQRGIFRPKELRESGVALTVQTSFDTPYRDERGQPEVPNGLSLCRIHHGAYDVNIVGIDPDYRLHVREDVLDEIDGPIVVDVFESDRTFQGEVEALEDFQLLPFPVLDRARAWAVVPGEHNVQHVAGFRVIAGRRRPDP